MIFTATKPAYRGSEDLELEVDIAEETIRLIDATDGDEVFLHFSTFLWVLDFVISSYEAAQEMTNDDE